MKKRICLPLKDGGGGGREEAFASFGAFSFLLFFSFFLFFPAATTAATAAAVCFCNCSSKASGEKAVLIVQITALLDHRTVPSNLCSHLIDLSN